MGGSTGPARVAPSDAGSLDEIIEPWGALLKKQTVVNIAFRAHPWTVLRQGELRQLTISYVRSKKSLLQPIRFPREIHVARDRTTKNSALCSTGYQKGEVARGVANARAEAQREGEKGESVASSTRVIHFDFIQRDHLSFRPSSILSLLRTFHRAFATRTFFAQDAAGDESRAFVVSKFQRREFSGSFRRNR